MGFDLKDMLQVVRDEAGQYGAWFAASLSSPAFVARQAERWSTPAPGSAVDAAGPPFSSSPNQFYVVLLMSAFIGATVGAIIPGRPPLKDRVTVAIVVVLVWFLISLFTHAIVRGMGGKGPASTTVKAMMQLLALVYVVSNLVGLITISAALAVPSIEGALNGAGLGEPGTIIVGTQLIMLLIYVPATIRKAHGFRVLAGCAAGFFGTLFAAAMAVVLLAQGAC